MRRLFWTTVIVLAAFLALCGAASARMTSVLDGAHALAVEISAGMERGDERFVRENLTALCRLWNEASRRMEAVCDAEALHRVEELLIQAKICMEYGDMEDFYTAAALAGEGIERIRDAQQLRWSNLY